MMDPNAIVWRGNGDIPSTKQGLKILGCPVGHPDFVQDQLSNLSDRRDVLLGRIAMVEDLQSAWLLMVYCAAARANFFLLSVSVGQISTFASHHDDQTWACLCTLLGIDPANVTHSSRIIATLPLRLSGLGLSSALRLRYAAHWANSADCIRMVYQRHPVVARTIIEAVEANDPAQTAQRVVSSIDSLRTAGFVIPSWDDLIREGPNQGSVEDEDPSQPRFGRQKDAVVAVHKAFLEGELRPLLDEPEEALLRSQGGSRRVRLFHQFAHAPGDHLRTSDLSGYFFPVVYAFLFLSQHAGAGVAVHSTAVATTGVRARGAGILGYRGYPMESVMARICREAGAPVRTNVMVRDLDLGAFNHLDGRRLEIIADGLPLWRGAQLAFDTTVVSPIRADGTARRHAAHRDGVALEEARRTKERKFPELAGNGGRARLVVVAAEVGSGSLLRKSAACLTL